MISLTGRAEEGSQVPGQPAVLSKVDLSKAKAQLLATLTVTARVVAFYLEEPLPVPIFPFSCAKR